MNYKGTTPAALQLILAALECSEDEFNLTRDFVLDSPTTCTRCLIDSLAIIAANWIYEAHNHEGREPGRCLEYAIGHLEVHLRDALDRSAP